MKIPKALIPTPSASTRTVRRSARDAISKGKSRELDEADVALYVYMFLCIGTHSKYRTVLIKRAYCIPSDSMVSFIFGCYNKPFPLRVPGMVSLINEMG